MQPCLRNVLAQDQREIMKRDPLEQEIGVILGLPIKSYSGSSALPQFPASVKMSKISPGSSGERSCESAKQIWATKVRGIPEGERGQGLFAAL